MEFTMENQYLKVTVITFGAQVKSVVRKSDGVEHMWNADPAVWDYHAPILFPYAGRLCGGEMEVKGQHITGLAQHGFARNKEHTLVRQSEDTIVLELTDTEETYKVWPFHFRLVSTFTLVGDTLRHTLTVENRDEAVMRFGIGFHPAFSVPFDDKHTATDYELRFDREQSPLCLCTPKGLLNGESYYLDKNIRSIAIDEHLFDNDSHCMANLSAGTLGIYEKDSGRAVVCDIREFPYTLIWSKPGMPRFVCIEPWHSIPSPDDGEIRWDRKPAAAKLNPGETWSTTLATSFLR